MKKLSVLTLFLFCAIASFSQGFPNNQSISNPVTLYHARGGLKADVGFVNTRYSDTTAANLTYIAHEPGSQIVVGNTVYVRDDTAVKWIVLGSSGTVIVGGDTTYVQLPLYVDTTGGIRTLKIFHPDGYEGGIVTYSGTGFDFNVSPITLYLHNKVFLFPATTLTLSAPNSLPRYDIFGVDSLGAFVKSGDSAALPIEPQVGIDSFALTKAFLISPGDTAPSNIGTVIIYDEHTINEYTAGYEGAASTIDFDNTDNPKHISKATYISSYHNGAQWYFYDPTYTRITPQSDQVITGWVYLNDSTTNNFAVFLADSNLTTTNHLYLSDYGIDRNNPNVYQQFSIPVNNFYFHGTGKYTTIEFQAIGSDTSGAGGLYMDYINLQSGVQNTLQSTDYSNKQDSNYARNDSLFWVAKGVEHFITKVGTCDTCISTVNISADSTLLYFIRVNGDTARVVDFYGSGGGSYQLPYNGNATDYLGGDTAYHPLPDISTKLNISDTASMISPYLKSIDTTFLHGRSISSFEKNATKDSAILTLNDGSRYAVKDSVGAGGGGDTDSSAIHVGYITIAGDTAIVFSDLKGNSDTVTLSLLNLWGLYNGSVYRQTGNVGVGTISPSAKLEIRRDTITDANISDSMGVSISNLYYNSGTNVSPPLIFKNIAGSAPHETRVRVLSKAVNAGSNLHPNFYIQSSIDSGKTYKDLLIVTGNTGAVAIAGPLSGVSTLTATTGNFTNSTVSSTINSGHSYSSSWGSIGTATYNKYAALLQMESTTQGLLPPRVTTVQRDSINLTVSSVTVVNGGTGYTSAPFLGAPVPYNNLSASLTANVSGGAITSVTVNSGGSYYHTPTGINIIGGGGSGAVLQCVMTQVLPDGLEIYCTDCIANDSSVGVKQSWQASTSSWKNNW